MPAKKGKESTIALLTDFGWNNWYIGVVKGVILGINPSATIIDLCHDISSQDVREGSFILGNSFRYFPAGTIFYAVVDPGVGGKRKNLVARAGDYLFVAPDNGILSCVFEYSDVDRVFEVKPGKYTLEVKGSTFYGRDIFAPIAAYLSLGVKPEDMGEEADSVMNVPVLLPVFDDDVIHGKAVYVDSFGNIITNIKEDFIIEAFGEDIQWDRVMVKVGGQKIRGVKRYYQQGERGKLIALINSWGFLEIAVNRGSAFKILNLREKKSLEITVAV
ncbi:MAG: hypothetical protein B6D63_00380 [Candidatus Latescibacteria bacterium 4484_7]|nr:MAG: hypothetical protein B6D63_00380 [Candidatus Latescibacteria bacterium 4484_7]